MPSDEASQTGAHAARTGPPPTSIPRSEDSLAVDAAPLDAARQTDGSNSVLGRISSQMAAIERRDAELWTIVVLTSTLIAAGLLATLAPAVAASPAGAAGHANRSARTPTNPNAGIVDIYTKLGYEQAAAAVIPEMTRALPLW